MKNESENGLLEKVNRKRRMSSSNYSIGVVYKKQPGTRHIKKCTKNVEYAKSLCDRYILLDDVLSCLVTTGGYCRDEKIVYEKTKQIEGDSKLD